MKKEARLVFINPKKGNHRCLSQSQKRMSLKIKQNRTYLGCRNSDIVCLLSICKALDSIPRTGRTYSYAKLDELVLN